MFRIYFTKNGCPVSLGQSNVVYLSVSADDDLSQMVVHGSHGLADSVQGHVHLPLHPVAIREQTHQLHYNLERRKNKKALF